MMMLIVTTITIAREIDEIGDFGKPALDAAAGNERLSRKDRQEQAAGPDPDLDHRHRDQDEDRRP